MNGKVEFYKDKAGKWRWRARASSGRILADSGQGYSRLGDARNGRWLAAAVLNSMRSDAKVFHWEEAAYSTKEA